jgi:uncharacterized protein (DUF427 family)
LLSGKASQEMTADDKQLGLSGAKSHKNFWSPEANRRPARRIRTTHRPSGEEIANGPVGLWGITPFEGNFYIGRKHLKTHGFRPSWVPGFCIYKFFYVYHDLYMRDGGKESCLAWFYWLPNPLLPFIAFRPAVPQSSPVLKVEEYYC